MSRQGILGRRTCTATGARLVVLAVLAAIVAGCQADPWQARICVRVVAVLAEPGTRAEIVETEPATDPAYDVEVVYRLAGGGGPEAERSVACAFAGRGLEEGRFALARVWTSHGGPLSEREMFWLQRALALKTAKPALGEAPGVAAGDPGLAVLYFLQQAVNALLLGAVYGLVAVAFTLVYGIIGKINFAFGEIYMIGAVGTVLWTVFFAALGGSGVAAALVAVFVLAAAVAGLYGWASERLVFRRLRRTRSHAPLIAAIGLVIFLQEFVRLLHTGRDFWLPADFSDGVVLAEAGGFTLYVSLSQAKVLVIALLVYGALAYIRTATAFGRAQRACADDTGLAALMGVNVDRTIAATFALGGLCAGIAGFIIVDYYGVANFFMGLMIGFKALTAAIVGGIGSVTGALWGALILAALEVFWSAYLDTAWKDVAVFGLLIVFLVFRPDGLMGVAKGRGD